MGPGEHSCFIQQAKCWLFSPWTRKDILASYRENRLLSPAWSSLGHSGWRRHQGGACCWSWISEHMWCKEMMLAHGGPAGRVMGGMVTAQYLLSVPVLLPSATSLLCLSLRQCYTTPYTEKWRRSNHVELCFPEAVPFPTNAQTPREAQI